MNETKKPLSFSLCPLNIAYIKAQVAERKKTNSRYSVSVWGDDLITHLRLKAEAAPKTEIAVTDKPKETAKRFVPPTIIEVWGYMIEQGCKADTECTEAHKFCDHFESNGWKVGGKTKMVSWKAAVRNFLKGKGNGQNNANTQGASKKKSAYERARDANDEYRQPNEREMVVGTDGGYLGRAMDAGEGRATIEHVDNQSFVDY